MIKQALLPSEKATIEQFLDQFDLGFSSSDESFYIEEAGSVIATLSLDHHIIKGLAIDPSYQGENLASQLISFAIRQLADKGIYHYHVFTKALYEPIFNSLGFRLLAKTERVAFMEGGIETIESTIASIRQHMEREWSIDVMKADIGTIVVNCNPMTLGHYQLIEQSAKEHDYLIVFVVETDESIFTYKERFSLVYLALKPISNILVVPSTHYIVSKSTFPSYFLKELNEREKEHAKLDALIFRDYFMPRLNISKRHVGDETDLVMVAYNQILKDTLKEKLVEIKRFKQEGVVISASLVRKYMAQGQFDEALALVPKSTQPLLKAMMMEKYAKLSSR